MSDKIDFPHFYKKGKLVKIRNLDKSTEKKEYIFSTGKTGIQTIINQCNNINQIVARCLLTTSKLSHYFGITKDISNDISKNQIPFNQFNSDLASFVKNDFVKNDFEKIYEIIEKQNKLTIKLGNTIEKHSILLENCLKNNQFVEKVAKEAIIEEIIKETNLKINKIQDQLKQMIG